MFTEGVRVNPLNPKWVRLVYNCNMNFVDNVRLLVDMSSLLSCLSFILSVLT